MILTILDVIAVLLLVGICGIGVCATIGEMRTQHPDRFYSLGMLVLLLYCATRILQSVMLHG